MHAVYPLPEALGPERGDGWSIHASPMAGVDLRTRQMYVPLGASSEDFCTRAHELAHVAWTRGDPKVLSERFGVDELIYQAVEDNRIEGWLVRVAGVDLNPAGLPTDRFRETASRLIALRDHRSACLLLIATTHGAAGPEVRAVVERAAQTWGGFRRALEVADGATARLWRGQRPSQELTGQTARWVQRQLDWPLPRGPRRSRRRGPSEADRAPSPTSPPLPLHVQLLRRARTMRGALRTALGLTPSDLQDDPGPVDPGVSLLLGSGDADQAGELLRFVLDLGVGPQRQFAPWGPMDVEEPERVIAHPGRMGRWSRPAEEGLHLRYPHRYASDRRVFGRRRRVQGGGVLIDVSGSMQLSAADVDRIVAAAPGAYVLGYAASSSRGVLRVLARDGRRVAPEHCDFSRVGTCNVIDLPALEYLVRLRVEPRLWVSDGMATGIGDNSGPENLRQVQELTELAGIRRLATVNEAIALLDCLSHHETRAIP
jgi:hypothetical protein